MSVHAPASPGLAQIGQIALAMKDLPRAVAFYRDVLGLPFLFEAPPKLAFFDCAGVRLMLSEPEKPEFDHPASIIYYRVMNMQESVAVLKSRGAVFESDPHLIAKMPNPTSRNISELAQGVTILTASTSSQYALEVPSGGAGVFTTLLVDALNGAAANLMGDVTPGSVYAHIDQSLGPWTQRPVFKTNVKKFISLRRAEPPISFANLRALTAHFPKPDHRFQLDPSYEPERTPEQAADPAIPAPDPAHTKVFAILQEYVKVNLVRPVNEKHMFHAAWHSESCELTVVGQHYWNLVDKRLI